MDIRYLVVHCSDSPNGRDDRAEDIHRWHLEENWDGIGYHAVIGIDGEVEPGRPHFWQGSHVYGHNHESLGVCLIGTDQFSDAQWRSLEGLLIAWSGLYPEADIIGHRDLDSGKTCPGFDVKSWWAERQKKQIG